VIKPLPQITFDSPRSQPLNSTHAMCLPEAIPVTIKPCKRTFLSRRDVHIGAS